jgi:SNF2 family DNA or RNA helicase
MQFNILLTTYEMVMRDSQRLNKIEWRYIVIDEAQRMKDSKSKLSRDLMKFKARRAGGGA